MWPVARQGAKRAMSHRERGTENISAVTSAFGYHHGKVPMTNHTCGFYGVCSRARERTAGTSRNLGDVTARHGLTNHQPRGNTFRSEGVTITISTMSDTVEVIERDGKTGRFVTGHKAAGPGRPKGARSKLGEAFLEDLRDVWDEMGIEALRRCAVEEPGQFVRVVASLMPRDHNINATVGVDAQNVLDAFRSAVTMLGNQAPAALPKVKVIDAA